MKELAKIVLPLIGRAGILKYVFLGIITGLSSFLFINTVSRVIALMIAGNFTSISKEYILVFTSIILLFIWSRRELALFSVDLSLKISWTLRKQILSHILYANYWQLSVRKARVYTAIRHDVSELTNASMNMIHFLIAVIMATGCFIYLASISLVLFAITLAVVLVGTGMYYLTSKSNMVALQKTHDLENEFQKHFESILDGFKEIYMEPGKGKYIYERRICKVADASYLHNTTAVTGFINNQVTGQILFYILITAVLLFFSIVLQIAASSVVNFVFTLLYLLGSIETIMLQFPSLMKAKVASNHLMELKRELEEANFKNRLPGRNVVPFEQLAVTDLEFAYRDAAFRIGPVNLNINKGEIIFIYGGNGSGKTTLVYSILGLCNPTAGGIRLNGIPVTEENYPEYKSLFAVVFNNFYLFDEITWEDRFDLHKWNFYVHLFELEGKVAIQDKRFSTTDLSTGQRKRLALIAALMERKPILVLDEWAADQDPYFRMKFYTQILPLLQREGTTILAITHDDKYYSCARRLFKMDEGNLIEENPEAYRPNAVPYGAEAAHVPPGKVNLGVSNFSL
ncbi:MAG TPA: cyclic peptide export ABC transporter [Cytophagales bacterium]|jgi:cyclic peptide transporter